MVREAVLKEHLLAVAIAAAQRGGEVLKRHFRRLTPDQSSEKQRNDWVSLADHESEREVIRFLAAATPEYGILGEESGSSGLQETRWVVDPLDGTTNFIRGFPHFAVSIALVDRTDVIVGAVYDPMRDETFYAGHGAGAYRDGARLEVSQRAGLAGGFISTGFPFRARHNLDAYLAVFREVFLATGGVRRPGAAALDLAHTASGIFDGFFEFGLSPWDIAAGLLLVREAGGIVTNLDGGADVLTRGNVVAGGPGVHAEIVALTSRLCRDETINV